MTDRELVRALKALADPTRFRMVQEIAAAGELSCGEVAAHFDVSQPTISHHLKILADAGILDARSKGKHHLISVNQELVKRLVDLIPARFTPAGKRESQRKIKQAQKAAEPS